MSIGLFAGLWAFVRITICCLHRVPEQDPLLIPVWKKLGREGQDGGEEQHMSHAMSTSILLGLQIKLSI